MKDKCIILSRVSTIVQDLNQQTEEVKKQALADGYTEIIIIEDKESAVKLDEESRLGLSKLKSLIIADKTIKCVYAYELSRIGRRPEVNYSIRDFLKDNKVQLIVLKPYIKLFNDDFSVNETSNMIFSIFNSLAENEGYLRKERTSRGRKAAKLKGRYIGGPVMTGYKIGEGKMIEIDQEKAEIVRNIFAWYISGEKSTRQIAKELYEMGIIKAQHYKSAAGCIIHILRNKRYTGAPDKDGVCYEPIISEEIWDRAQIKIKENIKGHRKMVKYNVLLRGIIKCKHGNMTNRKSVYSYLCTKTDGSPGTFVNIDQKFLDNVVWKELVNRAEGQMGEERRESTLRNIERELFVLDEKIAASASKFLMLEKKEEKINRRIIEGKMKEDIGDNLLQEIYDQRCQLEEDTRKWKLDKANLLTYRVFLSSGVGSFLNYSDITDDEEKIKIIRREIKQVFVDKEPQRAVHHGTVTITWSDGVVETYLYNSHKKTFSKKE